MSSSAWEDARTLEEGRERAFGAPPWSPLAPLAGRWRGPPLSVEALEMTNLPPKEIYLAVRRDHVLVDFVPLFTCTVSVLLLVVPIATTYYSVKTSVSNIHGGRVAY